MKTWGWKIIDSGMKRRLGAFDVRLREALLAAGRYWHQHFLQRHFSLSAFLWYGGVYVARSAGWTKRKVQAIARGKVGPGAVSPLVFTGSLMHAVMASAHVVASGSQARVEMQGPNWLKGFTAFGRGPDIRKELRAVAPLEKAKLGEIVKSELERTSV
jgi:hypothetical protein